MKVLEAMTRTLGQAGLQCKKHSPEILFVVGSIGIAASIVKAYKDGPKAKAIIDKAKEDIKTFEDLAKSCKENPSSEVVYTDADLKADMKNVYIHTGVDLAKVFAPEAIMVAASFTCMFRSNRILKLRIVALASAYDSLDKAFKNYRKNIVDNFGSELDKEARYDLVKADIEKKSIDKDGKEKTEKVKANILRGTEPSGNAIIFDAGDIGWDPNPVTCMHYLQMIERTANDRLKSKGYLTLNEVYEMFGREGSPAGLVNGWVYKKNGNDVGDNAVSFFLEEIWKEIRNAENDRTPLYNRGFLIDFNIDGYIYDRI